MTLHTQALPSISATGEPVRFYDKDAQPLSCEQNGNWINTDQDNVWVRGEVKDLSASCLEMNLMLHHGRVLALAGDKALVFQQKDDGNIIFYSVIPSVLPLSVAGSVEELRQMLKTYFAGWHHAYHEVFAMAKSFRYFIANAWMPDKDQLAR